MKIEFITKKELLNYINSKIEVYNRRMEECEKDESIGDHIPLLFEGKIESLVDLKNYITDNEPIEYGYWNLKFKEKYNVADIKDITFTVDFGEEINNLLADEEDYIPPGVRNKLNSKEYMSLSKRINSIEDYINNKEDLSWAINRLCEFHQYPLSTDKERRAMDIILKELGKENPCKDTFYK